MDKNFFRKRKIIAAVTAAQGLSLRTTIRITFPGVGWVERPNDARQGWIGSTLERSFIAIPSSQYGNHYFYFTHTDPYERLIDVDPGDYEESLTGFTGHACHLDASDRDPSTVARAFEDIGQSIFGFDNVIRTGDYVELIGNFELDNIFTGSENTQRDGGIWGAQREYINGHTYGFSTAGPVNGTFFNHMTGPEAEEEGQSIAIHGISWLPTDDVGSHCRLMIYEGGDETNPTSANLIFDTGFINASELDENEWNTRVATQHIEIPSAASLWVVYQTELSSTTGLHFQSIGAGNIGQWTSQNLFTGGIGNDPELGAPSTFPSGAAESGFALTPGIRIIWSRSPWPGNGQWNRPRWPTPRNLPASWPIPSNNFANQILCGGSNPPDVGGLYAWRIGCSMSRESTGEGARMWIMQGGSLRLPWEAITLPGSEVRLVHQITGRSFNYTEFPEPILITRNSPIWMGVEGDGIAEIYLEELGEAGFPNFAPRWGNLAEDNPYDWPDNVIGESELEFENIDWAEQEVNPANPTESPYPEGEIGSSWEPPVEGVDTFVQWRPENVTAQVVDLRTNAFVIEEI